MKLLTQTQLDQLLANGRTNADHITRDGRTEDFRPVVKLFCPWGGATWLLSEIDPAEPDIAFGLCDIGFGCPELGSVRISEWNPSPVPAASPSSAIFVSKPPTR